MWSGHLQKALAVFQDECTVHFHMRILYFHMRITLCSYVIGFVTCGSEFPPTVRQSVIWLYYVSSQILMCLSLEMTPLSTPSKYIIFFFFFKSIYLRFYYELKSNIQNLKLLWHHSSEETSICVSLTTQVAAVNSCCSFTFKRDCPDVSELISSWPFIPQKQ